ncbi:Lyzozyme M1 (1,4-beta-N-acetylmuramidase) [Secundilactobacillus kimchicus]|uniref:GH25 family lysozyme n=1 Tax=Secundilactobacillus kimchicus TaxID=528209 RepID=UPI001C02ECC6|nr:GH25 family lysozyme [Secundilactobacillus kimchicus]MBT9670549.1 Lyzozyme M1 (1,4-beta-N-acetylmuramidase) [Secundilactobacillus kimchicus]
MPRYDMVDISNNNGAISVGTYQAMKAKGVKAIIHKLSEGTYYQDAYAKANLQRAKSVGLATHGYHFARFTTVSGARSEANFAVACAKAAGLGKGSVLVLDFESNNLGWSQNNATTSAFAKIVKAAGYRYDLYTMGSWVNSVSINNDGRAGWIANYPYDATGKKYYGSYNSWQWTSGAHFAGSNSRFDVSVNYSNFYYGNKAVAKAPKNHHKYFRVNPGKIYTLYEVRAYKRLEDVGTKKNVAKIYKTGAELNVKKIVKYGDTTRFLLTNGYYITASKDYVHNLYHPVGSKVEVVRSVKGTNRYRSTNFKKRGSLVDGFPAGTEFDVKRVIKAGSVTRIELNNGLYISGNTKINAGIQFSK